jgi:hypothetical protein
MLRITLHDPHQTISFLAAEETARRLVAACASRPGTAGELLVAADVFEPGITTSIMAGLMAFDKALQRQGPAYAAEAAAQGRPFQVVNDATAAAARTPAGGALLLIDVAARRIQPSASLTIPREGEVLAQDDSPTPRRITYTLPREWQLGDTGEESRSET